MKHAVVAAVVLAASTLAACASTPTPTVSCTTASPAYDPNGTPSSCYVAGELSRVAPNVSTCASYSGLVEVKFEFDQAGIARNVSANLDCSGCRTPYYVDENTFLHCVQRAASVVRLQNAGKAAFSSAYWYYVGAPEDERLKLGWQPMDNGSH